MKDRSYIQYLIYGVIALFLCACQSNTFQVKESNLKELSSFAQETNAAPSTILNTDIAKLEEELNIRPNDLTRLKLAYLFSHPNNEKQDLDRSILLFESMKDETQGQALKSFIYNQVELQKTIKQLQREDKTKNNCTKEILSNENPAPIEELKLLQEKLKRLQTQLQVLKSIDDDLTQSQKAIDLVTQ